MKQQTINTFEDLESIVLASKPLATTHVGDILVEDGVINESQLKKYLAMQRAHPGKHLGELLIESHAVSREQLREALATKLGFPFIRIGAFEIGPDVLELVPADMARQYKVLPLAQRAGHLVVAMESPLDHEALSALSFNVNRAIDPVMMTIDDIQDALEKYYRQAEGEIDSMVEELDVQSPEDRGKDEANLQLLAMEAQKKPVVRLVNAIIVNAVLKGASDINIRPDTERVSIYYRVDGRMQLIRTLHKSLLPPLVSRIKIIARMDIAERRLPQDGHAWLMREGRSIDLRVSSVPTIDGESISIRLLDRDRGIRPIEELGFSEHDMQIIGGMLMRNHGLILATGPTGSGKTTTLYALLNEVHKRGPHIMTVEDPVEYDMVDVEQIQIAPAYDLSFSRVLRNILRHDPDVIMVGEIRDDETAEIATKAALTGHLVLSTLHTNDAASTVTRLIDMGIAPYLIGATMLGVLAQRLVKLNCPNCTVPEQVGPELRTMFDLEADEVFYHGEGCEQCGFSGVRGRATVYELLQVTSEIAELINSGANTLAIKSAAIAQGMVPLTRSAVDLARAGKISLEEVLSVRLD